MDGLDFEKYKRPDTRKKEKTQRPTNCESCVYYDYDEELDAYVCSVNLDEDEQVSFLSKNTARCPYYRYYDEYKSVRKQN